MKFPRNARSLRGQLYAAPFACVVFCVLIFVLLSSLVYTPGVRIQLPESYSAVPGVDGPTLAVALDKNGQLIFQNQVIQEAELRQRLKSEVAAQSEPLTLCVWADEAVTLKQLNHLRDLAASAGIRQISQVVLPRAFDQPRGGARP